ncbi:MAG: hypothetical protein NXH70_02320 [Hyphomonas sp.]|nr:hypothetical protein [Hyphomonas sp.]
MTKTTTKTKRTPKTTGKAKVTRTPGKAKTLADIKTPSTEDDDILAALDDEATATADEILANIETAETVDKTAIYEEQESTLSVDDTANKGDAPKAKRKRKVAEGEKQPRAKREINMTKLAEIYDDGNKMVKGIDTLPKKVQDKARNAFMAMTAGVRLSQYTGYAVEALKASENGTIEVANVRELLVKRGYKDGTASAQAQQQMALLPFLGVAERSGRMLIAKPGEAFDALTALV